MEKKSFPISNKRKLEAITFEKCQSEKERERERVPRMCTAWYIMRGLGHFPLMPLPLEIILEGGVKGRLCKNILQNSFIAL